jgi:hypothetical protein
MKSTRTYKLRLSDQGIALFLEQHSRLASLLRDFIPYGETLAVAIALLEAQPPCEVAGELASTLCKQGLGDNIRFVGFSPEVAELTKRISENLLAAGETSSAPKVVSIYTAALTTMKSADDREILRAHRRFERVRPDLVG